MTKAMHEEWELFLSENELSSTQGLETLLSEYRLNNHLSVLRLRERFRDRISQGVDLNFLLSIKILRDFLDIFIKKVL